MSTSYENQGNNQITIVDIDIPMGRMVILIFKWMIASIPAMIAIYILFAIVGLLFMALFGGMAAMSGAAG